MPDAITLPQLGESVAEGVITAWLVEVGDHLEVDQPLAEIATDKVDTEIPSPLAGRVHALRVDVDETVEVGQVIAEVVTDDQEETGSTDGAGGPEGSERPLTPTGAARDHAGDPEDLPSARLSPKVRRLLRERSVDPADVAGSGPGGRITPADVEAVTTTSAAAPSRSTGPTAVAPPRTPRPTSSPPAPAARAEAVATDAPVPSAPARPAPAPAATTSPPRVDASGRTETVRLPRIRRTIAERMHHSLQTTAQLTAVVEVDVTRLMTSRARAKDTVRERDGVALTPLALISRAVCEVLARHPVLNAEIDTEAGTATYHRDVHLGIAVDTDAGLIVPTIREAQVLTPVALARRIGQLAERSRSGELTPDDLTGGTFTITNTGSRGVMLDTPILNPPQVGILATTLIEKRPIVVTDEFGGDTLAIRQMSYLCLTYDHRLVDGADAARFLGDLKHTIETRDLLPDHAV